MRISALLALLLLSACASLPRPPIEPEVPATPKVPEIPRADQTVGRETTKTVDLNNESVEDTFVVRPLDSSDPLPDVDIKPFSLSNPTIYEAMRTILAGRVSFSVTPDVQGRPVQYGTVSAVNISGKLKDVLDELAQSLGFFYTYKHNVVRIAPDGQFVVALPPVDELYDGIAKTLVALGAQNVNVDKASRLCTFTASRAVYDKVAGYIDHIRHTKSLIVYDTYVYQVSLNDETIGGINWNKLNLINQAGNRIGLTGSSTNASANTGVGLDVVYSSNRLNLDVLIKFLQTQGTIKTISQPKITLLSGTRSKFKVATTTAYVSQVGTTVTGTAGITQTTVSTDKVNSGVEMSIAGDIDDGTVFSNIKLAVTDLIRFNTVNATGTTIQLPQTEDRIVETSVRARPGDAILLGGINTSRDSYDVEGLPGTKNSVSMLTDKDKYSARTELVIVLRPRVVRFVKGDRG